MGHLDGLSSPLRRTAFCLAMTAALSLSAASGLKIELPQPDPFDRHSVIKEKNVAEDDLVSVDPMLSPQSKRDPLIRVIKEGHWALGPFVWRQQSCLIMLRKQDDPRRPYTAELQYGQTRRTLFVQRLFRRLTIGPVALDDLGPAAEQEGTWHHWVLLRDGRLEVDRQLGDVRYYDNELQFDLAFDHAKLDKMNRRERRQWATDFWKREASLWKQVAGRKGHGMVAPQPAELPEELQAKPLEETGDAAESSTQAPE